MPRLFLLLIQIFSWTMSVDAQIFVVKPRGKEPVLKVGGLLQVQADVGDRGDGRFTIGDDRFYLRRVLRYDTFNPIIEVDNVNTDTWTLGFNYLFKGDDIKFMVNWLISDVPVLPHTQNKVLFRMQVIF
jgi:hypothetical protein